VSAVARYALGTEASGAIATNPLSAGTRIPSLLFAGYHMMFAVIAPALITGAFAERLLFTPYLIFIV
jgi:ammonium transporter, Amt family